MLFRSDPLVVAEEIRLDALPADGYFAQNLGTAPFLPACLARLRLTAPAPSPVRPIELRGLRLENNLVLAPMAGVSNLPFRLIAREAGAALAFTETVSAKGLVRGGSKTRRLLRTSVREAPVAFQLFGSDPEIFAEACRGLADEGAMGVAAGSAMPRCVAQCLPKWTILVTASFSVTGRSRTLLL